NHHFREMTLGVFAILSKMELPDAMMRHSTPNAPARFSTRWLLVFVLSCLSSFGQLPLAKLAETVLPPGTNDTKVNVESTVAKDLDARIADARARLAAWDQSGLTNGVAGSVSQDSLILRAALQRLVRLYEQQRSNNAAVEKARARKEQVARETQSWTRFSEPAPYSILLTDRLREEIQAERQKINSGEAALG